MSKVILCTFAGRSDRMKILKTYVDAALQKGLIDEWHIWDYSRTSEDQAWLRRNFPYVQGTPAHVSERVDLPRAHFFQYGANPLAVHIRAEGYTFLCLTSVANPGIRIEVTMNFGLGGRSVLQVLGQGPPLIYESLHHLSEFAYIDLAICISPGSIEISNEGKVLFNVRDLHSLDDQYLVRYGSGDRFSAEWIFPAYANTPYRLFIGSDYSKCIERHPYFFYTQKYSSFYRFYGDRTDSYQKDVFIKCDDDIVYLDLTQLSAYIEQRRRCKEFFLLSANVVNNGVCAYFQSRCGRLSDRLANLELPTGGFGGTLWESGELANAMHYSFLADPSLFSYAKTVIWNQRISINFISWMGEDAKNFPDFMIDDEEQLAGSLRRRAKKCNAIYGPFVVSHLSFYTQERQKEFRVQDILACYEKLAESECQRFVGRITGET